jgi:hypothetical protein
MGPIRNHQRQSFHRVALVGMCGLLTLGLLGCEEAEVKKYNAPREKPIPDFTRLAGYKVPEGWTRLAQVRDPSKDPSKEALVTFQVRKDDKTVQITVTRFPGTGGGVNFNIMRWRGQIGFPKAANKAEMDKEMRQIEKDIAMLMVDGEKTPYVDLTNPDKTDAGRILGVVAERGLVTWFFKMHGPSDLVGEQKAAFEAFMQSVKFGGTGANDG